nr:acyltransferase family protein [Arthrobacter sp. efr-133-TYG-104]
MTRKAFSVVGFLLILLSCFVITANQAFPGSIALFPVVGTVLVIAGGTADSPVNWLLGARPMQWIGDRSYSWYLWHWPAMILIAAATGIDSPWLGLGIGAATLVLAHYTFLKIENPVRHYRPLKVKGPSATYAFTSALLAVAALVAAGVFAVGTEKSMNADIQKWNAVREQGPPAACPTKRTTKTGQAYCVAGPENAAKTVMIVGDSHAAQWVPTLAAIAADDGFRLVIRTLDACPAAEVSVLANGSPNKACAAFHASTRSAIEDIRPTVLLTANSDSYLGQITSAAGKVPTADEQAALWSAGMTSVIQSARQVGAEPASIEDTPRPIGDAAICVTRPGGSEDECTPSVEKAEADVAVLKDTERALKIEHVLSFDDDLCDKSTCKISDGGTPVFSDQSHISQAWAATQKGTIRALVREALSATSS